jgi:hypothetical protein
LIFGALLVVATLFLLSAFGVGGSPWLAMVLGSVISFGAVAAKIATTVGASQDAPSENVASALAINEMAWALGVSVGSALFFSTLSIRGGTAHAFNPFYHGENVGFSDAFLVLVLPVVIATAVGVLGWRYLHEDQPAAVGGDG